VAWRAGYARRVGAIGARGSVRALATQDAGLTRGELSISNWITAPGRRHPWWTWTITGQYLDRDAEESFGGPDDRVDPAYWSPGRTMNAGGSLRLDTKGPRRREAITLEAWHGFDSDGNTGEGVAYDRVSLEAHHDRWPVVLFFDAARLRADGPYDRLLANAGAGIHLGYLRLDAPFWISTPEPCEPPFDFRWTFSVELPEVRWR
jgi:hypothetical protein